VEALGRLFDVMNGWDPQDMAAGAITGKRVHLKNAAAVTILVFKEPGTAGEDPTFTLQEHSAASSGTSQNLAVITHYYYKKNGSGSLAGTETWTKATQAAAATVTDATWGESGVLLAIEVNATQLSDGFEWVSLNSADTGATAGDFASCVYLLHDLAVQRGPANLAQTNA
jgi:hypothetical protein